MINPTVFEEAKRAVSAYDIAELNGLHPNRGKYICCPLHHERTASLKLYDDGGWHCFGCNQGGDSVSFAAALYGLSPLDAVRRLNDEFRLGLPLDKPPNKAQQKAAHERQKILKISDNYEQWRDSSINLLNSAYRKGHLILTNWPDRLTESEALAVKWHATLEYWSDMLTFGSLDEQIEILDDWSNIERLCKRILVITQKESVA